MGARDLTLFISDLHLDDEDAPLTRSFLDFISERTASARAPYILGDLFEAWVGDDDDDPLAGRVASALKEVSGKGCEVFLMHGNRDFLIGEDYARRCGARLIQEPCVIDCHGHRAVLMHGDTLCTRDHDYMQFRKMVRSDKWQADFLARPLVERQMIVQQARMQSKEANSRKANDIMDVSHPEVVRMLEEHQVNLLIHGHTHRPAVHTIHLEKPVQGSKEARRIVLGSWDSRGWVLEFSDDGYELRHFSLQDS